MPGIAVDRTLEFGLEFLNFSLLFLVLRQSCLGEFDGFLEIGLLLLERGGRWSIFSALLGALLVIFLTNT
jgi:hypothetical protein